MYFYHMYVEAKKEGEEYFHLYEDRFAACGRCIINYHLAAGSRYIRGCVIWSNYTNSKVKQVGKVARGPRHAPSRAGPPLTYIRLYNATRRVLRMLMHVKLGTV